MAFICKMRYDQIISYGFCKVTVEFPHPSLHCGKRLCSTQGSFVHLWPQGLGSCQLSVSVSLLLPSTQSGHNCSCNLEHLLSAVQTRKIKKVSQCGQNAPPHSPLTAWPGRRGAVFLVKLEAAFAERCKLWVRMEGVWCDASSCTALSKRPVTRSAKYFRRGIL